MNWRRAAVTACFMPVLIPLAAGAEPLDRPVLASDVQGHAKIVTLVTAGPSGAPAGFTLQWMKFADFLANDGQFYDAANDVQSEARFTGVPTLNTWDGELASFTLGPSAVAAVEIGDLYDETGVATSAMAELDLLTATPYILRARANGDGFMDPSEWSNVFIVSTALNMNCTYTLGYWKTHGPPGCVQGNNSNAWPVTSLSLGTVNYTDVQLCSILNQPAQGNGLIILAHQVIATLLNMAQGANGAAVASTLASAQSLIGSLVVPPVGGGYLAPSATSALAQVLDNYNNGLIGPGHCGTVAVDAARWSTIKATYR